MEYLILNMFFSLFNQEIEITLFCHLVTYFGPDPKFGKLNNKSSIVMNP